MCLNETLARYARQHNGANVLALGSTLVTTEPALTHRRDVPRHADARGPLHPAAGQDPRSRDTGLTVPDVNATDVQRLIQIIVEELAAARAGCSAAVRLPLAAVRVLPGPAARRPRRRRDTARACMRRAAPQPACASMIDHTLLKPDATRQDIETLCREAAEYRFASVCVNPDVGRRRARGCFATRR